APDELGDTPKRAVNVPSVIQRYMDREIEIHVHAWIRPDDLNRDVQQVCARLQAPVRDAGHAGGPVPDAVLSGDGIAHGHFARGHDGGPEYSVFISIRQVVNGQQGMESVPLPGVVWLSRLDQACVLLAEPLNHQPDSLVFPVRLVCADGELGTPRSPLL